MKQFIFATALVAATPAFAGDVPTNVRVFDHNKTVVVEKPVVEGECWEEKIPVYGKTVQNGDAAGGALAGMILGGILGKGVTGDDGGAAAGAVIGGLIGADKGSKPKTQRTIIGYEYETKCAEHIVYEQERQSVYSHSTIRFYINGKRYVLTFQK